ncbi:MULTISPECIES: TetR/AcrR family transcriptional regulator [Acinetobacter]|jgi:AcrR family transcriptional regulator|uniref:TetR/AcrR family transcriptional regulator n=2 Tax=Acinetobacter TaxID=469 RepID=A0A4Q7AUB5_9GAMM|nr:MULTISPECIES: TetR/AcrR family transcriptional regulator [Acinetobacter]MCW8039031.1 TetR/AcrR family transcriptional regulator [Acinetobacter entericus]RZG65955.1 TetR/AcrR family transcriptional regulator [Acinetobacter bouvetii]TCB74567.1 TetR/AcrR family transcriptional regulator [Acinetobacter sp. ANC 4177]
MNKSVKRKNYHVGNLESQLIDQAKKMLEEVGPDKLSIRAISEQVGVSATAVYHHFANKDELLSHLAAQGFAQLETVLGQCQQGIDKKNKMQVISRQYMLFAFEHPAMYQLMFGSQLAHSEMNPTLSTARKNAYAVVEQCVADVLEKDIQSKEVRSAALAAWSFAHGLASLMIHNVFELPEHISKDAVIEKALLGFNQLVKVHLDFE